jgi:hypothetical protein
MKWQAAVATGTLAAGMLTAAGTPASASPGMPAAKCQISVTGAPGNQYYTLAVVQSCGSKIRAAAQIQHWCIIPPYPIYWAYGRGVKSENSSVINGGLCPKTWKLWGWEQWIKVTYTKPGRHQRFFKWVWSRFHKLGCCDHISD